MAGLVAKRASSGDIDSLRERLQAIELLLKGESLDKHKFVELEIALHQRLPQMCGNALYFFIIKSVHDLLLRPAFLEDQIDAEYVRTAISDWHRIIDAMERRSSNEARGLMEAHVLDFAKEKQGRD